MKLDPATFWRLSLREWLLMQQGFFEMIEAEQKLKWEIARWQIRIIAAPDYKQGAIERITRLAWDAPPEDPRMTDEELEVFLKRMGTRIENGKFVN